MLVKMMKKIEPANLFKKKYLLVITWVKNTVSL